MSDILYGAAIEYKKLNDTIYKIILGRKGKSFYHLAGLQHLKDITFPSTNKERIYKEILKKRVTIDNIKKSIFYSEAFIEERMNANHVHFSKNIIMIIHMVLQKQLH